MTLLSLDFLQGTQSGRQSGRSRMCSGILGLVADPNSHLSGRLSEMPVRQCRTTTDGGTRTPLELPISTPQGSEFALGLPRGLLVAALHCRLPPGLRIRCLREDRRALECGHCSTVTRAADSRTRSASSRTQTLSPRQVQALHGHALLLVGGRRDKQHRPIRLCLTVRLWQMDRAARLCRGEPTLRRRRVAGGTPRTD